MNFIKKLKLFKTFRKVLKDDNLKIELENNFGVRVDNAYRLYTILNIPEDLVGDAYSLKKSDIAKISENFVREFTQNLSRKLDSVNLSELYKFYRIEKVDKYSWLIVVGFSLFKSNKFYNRIYYGLIPSLVLAIILSLVFFL